MAGIIQNDWKNKKMTGKIKKWLELFKTIQNDWENSKTAVKIQNGWRNSKWPEKLKNHCKNSKWLEKFKMTGKITIGRKNEQMHVTIWTDWEK